MKSLTLIFSLLFVGLGAQVQAGDLDLGGIGDLIGEKVKEAKVASLFDLKANPAGALYLPVWVFHGKAKESPDYFELGLGGMLQEQGHGAPFLAITMNLPAISAKLWDFDWAKSHVRRSKFPPIFFGPYVLMPLPDKTWVIGESMGVMVSVGIGNK